MEGGGVYDDSRMLTGLLNNEGVPRTSEILGSLWVPDTSASVHGSGSASMLNFEDVRGENNSERPLSSLINSKVENYNEDFDGRFHQPEKKRRLPHHQVQFLEKSFEVENKLEPERKAQLAKEIGLQPRQVAIWFQNRRARCKTKVLEKEYDVLKASHTKLKLDYDNLSEENEKMKNEVNLLTEKLLMRENGKVETELCDPIGQLDLQSKKPILTQDLAANVAPVVQCKQEDAASSAKSDLFDSDSPHCTDANHSASLEPADSSHAFESDFSHDEDESLSRSLLPPSYFPKPEIVECYDDLQPNSCNLGFPVQYHGTWLWQY